MLKKIYILKAIKKTMMKNHYKNKRRLICVATFVATQN